VSDKIHFPFEHGVDSVVMTHGSSFLPNEQLESKTRLKFWVDMELKTDMQPHVSLKMAFCHRQFSFLVYVRIINNP